MCERLVIALGVEAPPPPRETSEGLHLLNSQPESGGITFVVKNAFHMQTPRQAAPWP